MLVFSASFHLISTFGGHQQWEFLISEQDERIPYSSIEVLEPIYVTKSGWKIVSYWAPMIDFHNKTIFIKGRFNRMNYHHFYASVEDVNMVAAELTEFLREHCLKHKTAKSKPHRLTTIFK